jgi:hypothetical protein
MCDGDSVHHTFGQKKVSLCVTLTSCLVVVGSCYWLGEMVVMPDGVLDRSRYLCISYCVDGGTIEGWLADFNEVGKKVSLC